VVVPRGGQDYPRSVGEFLSWFGTDADCRDYLAWLRWPDGFVCDECGHVDGWRLADGRWECAACSHRTSVTAGTIFDRTRTSLTVWFHACWSFATAKDGISALGLQRTLQIGSYQTAWAMLHRLRSVLIRPDRELLFGQVEVDETYIGGEEARLAGGRAKGKKALVAVAVELKQPKGFGRCRMRVIPDGSASTLHTFITDNVATGSTVITDGWSGYLGIDKSGYLHDRRSQRAAKALGEDIGKLLPGVHRVASLAKRPGRGGRRAPTRLPGRVLLPVQPSPFTQPRTGLPASTPTRRWPRPGPLPAADQTTPATQGAATAARSDRAPAQHRPPPRDPPLATL
jgi:hypothetical protein